MFVRDPSFHIPVPTSTYLQLEYTSLIFLEAISGLEVVEDRLGLVSIREQGERADRTAVMVSSSGNEPEGVHLVLLKDQDDYHKVIAIEIGKEPQVTTNP